MRAKCAYYWQKMRLTYLSHFITRQSYIKGFLHFNNMNRNELDQHITITSTALLKIRSKDNLKTFN